ncbi:MAG: hypothetical protein A2W80_03505 [Candidatus Riflebacteria bacterium GWC2_50_8]|nr:MAG: hypothetical protein A2W80_03505 [Candidatus Riflebacteria bacterium GWC2_50_8]
MKKIIAMTAILLMPFWNNCPVVIGQIAAAKSKAAAVRVVEAALSSITEEFTTTGSLVADNSVTVRSTAEGPVIFCPWREGDRVERGEKLVEIDRPLYMQEMMVANSALAVAKAKLADLVAGTRREEISQARELTNQREDALLFAEKDHERITSLVNSGALPAEMEEKSRVNFVKAKTDLAAAKERLAMLKAGPTKTEIAVQKALVDEAEAKAAMARAKYEECLLLAPFSGIVTKTYARTGDLATPRAPLIDLIDPNSLVVRFAVPEIYAARVTIGQQIEIKLDAYPGQTFPAVVKRVFADLEKTTRTRSIEASIEPTDSTELLPGMFARVSAKLRTETNTVIVPDEAVLSTPRGEKIVFVVVDGKAERKIVVTGIEQQRQIQVVEGLKGGEQVVTEGSRSLKDKMEVAIIADAAGDKPKPADNDAQAGVIR